MLGQDSEGDSSPLLSLASADVAGGLGLGYRKSCSLRGWVVAVSWHPSWGFHQGTYRGLGFLTLAIGCQGGH